MQLGCVISDCFQIRPPEWCFVGGFEEAKLTNADFKMGAGGQRGIELAIILAIEWSANHADKLV